MKREDLLTVRIEPKLKERIRVLEKEKMETMSNIVREALISYVQKETEMIEIRKLVAEKFAADKISFDEAVRILGYEEAKKIAFFVEIAKKSFEKGLK